MEGWAKIKKIAVYAGVSERTLRNWLKQGLRYSRLKSGMLLIKYSWVDDFLSSHEVTDEQAGQIGRIVNEVMKDFRK